MTNVQLYSKTFNPGPMFEYSAKEALLPSLKYRHRVLFKSTILIFYFYFPEINFTLTRDLIDYGTKMN